METCLKNLLQPVSESKPYPDGRKRSYELQKLTVPEDNIRRWSVESAYVDQNGTSTRGSNFVNENASDLNQRTDNGCSLIKTPMDPSISLQYDHIKMNKECPVSEGNMNRHRKPSSDDFEEVISLMKTMNGIENINECFGNIASMDLPASHTNDFNKMSGQHNSKTNFQDNRAYPNLSHPSYNQPHSQFYGNHNNLQNQPNHNNLQNQQYHTQYHNLPPPYFNQPNSHLPANTNIYSLDSKTFPPKYENSFQQQNLESFPPLSNPGSRRSSDCRLQQTMSPNMRIHVTSPYEMKPREIKLNT